MERAPAGGAHPLNAPGARILAALAALLAAAGAPVAGTEEDAGEARAFSIPYFTTTGGALVRDMTFAWTSRGRLDFRGENAVLALAGLHGEPRLDDGGVAGAALDAGGLFVLAIGAPCGPAPATGPDSVDPETGAVWGDRFPALVVGDLVAAQKALADSLGVKRVRAVVGAGFGGALALEWRRRYPHMVEAAIAAGPPPEAALGDESCQAGVLRRRGAADAAAFLPGPEAARAALAKLLADRTAPR